MLKIKLENQEIDPFFAVALTGQTKTVRGRVALIVVDISGSMNIKLPSGRTRFQTAQEAMQQFLDGFDESVDHVAIVPFESHNVAGPINNAQFATTKTDVSSQIEALPVPQPRNNTALYSAIVLGLQVLSKQSAAIPGSPETQLIVMTDGKNEVYKGDDPGLLDGPAGLEEAVKAVRSSGTQVIGIGFGSPGSADVDEAALRQLSTKFYMAQDLSTLKQAFTVARTLQTNRMVATFTTQAEDRSSLEGKTLHVSAALNLPGGRQFQSGEQIWAPPEMSVPTFDGKCDTDELKAALQLVPTSGNWLPLLRPVLVFFGLATLLLVLWFWVPRLVWAEQYIGTFAIQGGSRRWADKSQVRSKSPARPSRSAPPGFETRKGGAQPPRAPADRTVVQPDFSMSRLQKRPPQD